MKLLCKLCGRELTSDLSPLEDLRRLSEEDGMPRIPKGYFHVSEPESDFDPEGSIVANLEDLTGANRAMDGRPYNGCCGVDGCDGLNLVCPSGHDVATEKSDCWMPHRAVFESELVILRK
jgi:hypothetical protein